MEVEAETAGTAEAETAECEAGTADAGTADAEADAPLHPVGTLALTGRGTDDDDTGVAAFLNNSSS